MHTTITDGKDPKKELQSYLLSYRATPRSISGKSPAEMLFGRKLKTKLPQLNLKQDSKEMKETRKFHDNKKLKQKAYFDQHKRATHKEVRVGDKILIRQQMTTIKPSFDPRPYEVTKVKGNRITSRRHRHQRVRDKNHIKVVKNRAHDLKPSWDENLL